MNIHFLTLSNSIIHIDTFPIKDQILQTKTQFYKFFDIDPPSNTYTVIEYSIDLIADAGGIPIIILGTLHDN